MRLLDINELRQLVRAGWTPEYVFFLEPEPTREGVLGSECLSQWYPAPMEVDGVRFPTAEHYMMWRKARLFGDDAIEREILADDNPGIAKQLGRRIRNFNGEIWTQHRFEVVLTGSLAKFQQHPRLRTYLLETRDRVLAEASPVDYIWGIGFDALDERAKMPLIWKGINLLGFVLMHARAHFRDSNAPAAH